MLLEKEHEHPAQNSRVLLQIMSRALFSCAKSLVTGALSMYVFMGLGVCFTQ